MTLQGATAADWIPVAAAVLGLSRAAVSERAGDRSFTELGGTSLQAAEYCARLALDCGRLANIAELLGPRPLAIVAAETPDASRPEPPAFPAPSGAGPLIGRAQEAMLAAEQRWGCEPSPFHLMFSASITGVIDVSLLKAALAQMTRRHAALRTIFTRDPETGSPGARVLAAWEPALIEQELPPLPPGADPVDVVHALLAPAAPRLLRPYDQPPVVFVLSHAGPRQAVLSILAHHAVADGWSIGLLWEQIAAGYGAPDDPASDPAPGMEHIVALERAAVTRNAPAERAAALEGWPTTVHFPGEMGRPPVRSMDGCRLGFGLSTAAQAGCEAVASAAAVTRNAVILAAWALIIARRAGIGRLVIGMPTAARTTAMSRQVVGCGTKLLPVPCEIRPGDSVIDYVRLTAQRLREALGHSDVPFEDIATAAGASGASSDLSGNPLVQVVFDAHDELIAATLTAGDLTFSIREGHCGGGAVDATLYLQRWEPAPALALEYATSVLAPAAATSLAASLDRTLAQLAEDPYGPVADVTTMTASQRQRLLDAGAGPTADTSAGLWDLIASAAERHPDALAVRDADQSRSLTYRELITAVEAQSAALAAAGVREGDCVAVAVSRSRAEIVAIAAILRLGAAYTGLDPALPPSAAAAMLDQAGVRAVVGQPGRLAALGTAMTGRWAVPILGPGAAAGAAPPPPAAAPDPERTAYVAFTSGSAGLPKAAMVACRGVVRLARDPAFLLPGAAARFMRLAPLASDASALEIFVPLLAGGTVEIFPGSHVAPDALAAFVRERSVTGLWLTAGLFRLAADYRPDAFSGVVQLLTGGDVVPPRQVGDVLRACPGLRVTHGYGPTENTTFTTVFHLDDPAVAGSGTLPIGRPIPGTGVLVLDDAGRLVPPGGVGELYVYGDGLAKGYAGLPEETARAFGRFSPDTTAVLYRTGDLAYWDGTGNLRLLGRRDRQLTIRGFRVEPDFIAGVLRDHPAVRDAVVIATAEGSGDRQILAAIVAAADPVLAAALRAFASQRLPGYAVPSLWAIAEELPVTRNGKLDVAALTDIAMARETGRASQHPADSVHPPSAPADDPMERAIADVWQQVLGHGNFGRHDRFFDVGGD